MIQQAITLSITKPYNDDVYSNNTLLRISKRKFSFPALYDNDNETIIITNKRRKKCLSLIEDDDIISMGIDCSILRGADASLSSSGQDDIFDWMNTLLNGGTNNDEASIAIPETTSSTTTTTNENSTHDSEDPGHLDDDDVNLSSFLTTMNMNESDRASYDEMILLLAKDDNDNDEDTNIFKRIQESFISDRLVLQNNNVFSSKPFQPDVASSKTSKNSVHKSSSFTRRARGLEQLVNATRLSSTSRKMLLNCKLDLIKNKNQ